MKIAILADSHNNVENTQKALEICRTEGVETIFHCGDITTERVVALFAGWQVLFAQGNMDLNHQSLHSACRSIGAPAPRRQINMTLDGCAIAMVHGHEDEVLQNLIESQQYRYIFHGHTHIPRDHRVGKTRVINPGTVGSMRGAPYSFAILDLATDDLRQVRLETEDWLLDPNTIRNSRL